jgi:hypothetical protein
VWRVLQEVSLASLPSLQPAIISGNGERLYIEALARASRQDREGRWFKSTQAHQFATDALPFLHDRDVLSLCSRRRWARKWTVTATTKTQATMAFAWFATKIIHL